VKPSNVESQNMTPDTTYVIPFKSKGRLFVEIPQYIEREGCIVAGEPLQLELIGQDIVYRKTADVVRRQKGEEGRTSSVPIYSEQDRVKAKQFWKKDWDGELDK
jgi:hypothetical protein